MSKEPLRIFRYLALVLFLMAGGLFGEAKFPQILSHSMLVSIEPAKSELSVNDTLRFAARRGPAKYRFLLNTGFQVLRIVSGGAELKFTESKKSAGANLIEVSLGRARPGTVELRWQYQGKVQAPVTGEQTLSFVRGEETRGHISDKGIYLAPQTYWYPDVPDSFATFRLRVSVPAPFRVVTQGSLVQRASQKGRSVSEWYSDVPADGLVLVGNRFLIKEQRAGPIEVGTYFTQPNVGKAELFLAAASKYLKTYAEIFGSYPYARFSTVENFFSTGHGMPGFTLLGPYVISRGEMSLKPGYLDHEIVHCWWGNYVFLDKEKGNWCEALTTYWSNYYQKELGGGEQAAAHHRRLASLKYSIRVPEDRAYALVKFRGKRNEIDGAIGYDKGSMFFHQVRRKIGDKAFRIALQAVVRQFGGKKATWADFQKAFERAGHTSLQRMFQTWLYDRNSPQLEVEITEAKPARTGLQVRGILKRTVGNHPLDVPVVLSTNAGRQVRRVRLKRKCAYFDFLARDLPTAVEADPDFEVFRRLRRDEWSPCLNGLLAMRPVIVLGDPAKNSPYRKIAAMLAHRGQVDSFSIDRVRPKDVEGRSVLVIGSAAQCSRLFQPQKKPARGSTVALPPDISVSPQGFAVVGAPHKAKNEALLAVWLRQDSPGQFAGCYLGNSVEAAARWRYIFYYGWDSYVVFSGGRPAARGEFPPARLRTRQQLDAALAAGIRQNDLMDRVKQVAVEGRFPGTQGALRTAMTLADTLKEFGVQPLAPVFLQRFDLKATDLIARENEKRKKHPAYPHFVSANAGRQGNILAANVIGLLKACHPAASDQYVVLGAHYDSLGKDGNGKDYLGADDNGSGVAALLAAARALSSNQSLLRRSVVFAFFDAEEWGLLGSKYFLEHYPVPIGKIKAMINADSVGAGTPGQVYLIGGSHYPALAAIARSCFPALGLREGRNIDPFAFEKGSDFYSFHRKGIPVLNLFAGNYRRMNSREDTSDKIDPSHLEKVSRLLYLTALKLATDTKRVKPASAP